MRWINEERFKIILNTNERWDNAIYSRQSDKTLVGWLLG